MKKKIFLGVDTSNYTTSLAAISLDGGLLANLKRPLPVEAGECGLRQSDAVFAHIKSIGELASELKSVISDYEILAVGVSSRPRNQEGSYMPVFLVGKAVAEAMASAVGVPVYYFSHQCGHVMAALYSSSADELLKSEDFAAFHVSGGTTELLRTRFVGDGFISELVGGTKDLNAGQVIDRVGVYMSLPFPSGAYMQKLAEENKNIIPRKKISKEGTYVNLSGLENLAKSLYDKTGDKALVSAFVFDYIGEAISSMASEYVKKFGESSFVFAGGVMSNSIIKGKLSQRFKSYFAEPELSRDNAVGISALARLKFLKENTCEG